MILVWVKVKSLGVGFWKEKKFLGVGIRDIIFEVFLRLKEKVVYFFLFLEIYVFIGFFVVVYLGLIV